MAIITVADFQVHYPNLVGTANNVEINTVIGQADALLALLCGLPAPDAGARTLAAATYTVYPAAPDPCEPRRIRLPLRPVVSVTSVHVDIQELYGAATLLSASEYVLDGQRGELWLTPQATHAWYTTGRANKVVVSAGFSATPPDLKAIAISATRHLWDRRRTQGIANQASSGTAQTYADATGILPQAVRDALGPYVLWGADAS